MLGHEEEKKIKDKIYEFFKVLNSSAMASEAEKFSQLKKLSHDLTNMLEDFEARK